jgi:hypothetical protein
LSVVRTDATKKLEVNPMWMELGKKKRISVYKF